MNKKELILNTALKLFVEQGFHGTATAKITKEAGVATGTLFQHFKTKEELIIALFVEIKNEITNFIHEQSANETTTKGLIKAQIKATVQWALANNLKFDYIQLIHASPYLKQIDSEEILKHMQVHYTLIEKGKAENLLVNMPTDLLYALISSQTFGLYQYLISVAKNEIEQENIINKTISMLWEMISKQ